MKRALASLILASLLMTTLPLNAAADDTDDIPTNVTASNDHASLVAALTHANLVETLQGAGPFTVFAPTDAAFAAAGIDLADYDTEEENATLVDILTYHVYEGSVAAADVTDGMSVGMLNGDQATFAVTSDGTVTIGAAKVTTADVVSSNGIIHIIDAVLLPPADAPTLDIPATAQSTGVHTALVAALSQANLVSALQADGPFTVFAPTDAAFEAAGIDLTTFDTPEENATLADILTYHVYSGAVPANAVTDGLAVNMLNGDKATFAVSADGVVSVGGANVTTADVQTTNGIIHVIDKVLLPPPGDICYNVITHTIVAGASNVECNSYIYVENYTMAGQTITGCYNTVSHAVTNVSQAVCGAYVWTPAVSIAMTAGATTLHASLVAALQAADLVTTLSGTDEYTVFAPTDAAFAAAGIDLDTFDTPEEIAVLKDILLYHVVAGTTLSTDLVEGDTTVTAANGDDLLIQVTGTAVTVGSETARVTLADVPASNGVIHVIDKVLTPPVDEPVLPDCDVTVGIAPSGLKFSPATVNIDVGQTVCWQWTDSSMAHNVRQVDGDQSDTYTADGVTSGAAATTVDFRYTFDVDSTTFYYACEPHLSSNMFGKVIVGDGGAVETVDPVPTTVDDSDDEESVPGFLAVFATLALIGAAFVSSRRNE
ncbi:MAG: fasciclin domain-containing protein [Candidatus Poseidoniaceae archaeon]|nr:fasciclin domain-containing protein [Candidatus Poseidoniaceae archaeon]